MAAAQTAQFDAQRDEALRQRLWFLCSPGDYVDAAGAAQIEAAPFLSIQIEQQAALQGRRIEPARAAHAGLLIDGEQRFQGTMLQAVILQRGQRQRHADTVVGAQRRFIGT